MNTFILPTGRVTVKNAAYCVATKARGRWHHRYFKSYKGAQNEHRQTSAYLRNPEMVAYYGLESCKLIKGEPAGSD
jgi:hypothetical protein